MTVTLTPGQRRILKDILFLNREPLHDSGIYIHHDEENISRATAVLFGPEDTPYAYGAYLFEFNFPSNYPFVSPKAKFCTYDQFAKTRFHPNLYVEGKVCLSILGTWDGPGWTSVQTFSSLLLSIKSLFDENPLENEPGFENTTKENNENYNGCVRYQNCRIAVLHQTQHLNENFKHFLPIIEEYYIKNYSKIKELWTKYEKEYNKEYSLKVYGMHVKADYAKMIEELDVMYNSLSMKHPELVAKYRTEDEPTLAVEEKKKKKKIKIMKIIKK